MRQRAERDYAEWRGRDWSSLIWRGRISHGGLWSRESHGAKGSGTRRGESSRTRCKRALGRGPRQEPNRRTFVRRAASTSLSIVLTPAQRVTRARTFRRVPEQPHDRELAEGDATGVGEEDLGGCQRRDRTKPECKDVKPAEGAEPLLLRPRSLERCRHTLRHRCYVPPRDSRPAGVSEHAFRNTRPRGVQMCARVRGRPIYRKKEETSLPQLPRKSCRGEPLGLTDLQFPPRNLMQGC